MTSRVHFITVSRRGVLTARRRGQAPIEIARAEDGLEVRFAGEAGVVRVRFEPGGGNLAMHVTGVVLKATFVPLEQFQQQFQISDAELGQTIRAAIDAALDANEKRDV